MTKHRVNALACLLMVLVLSPLATAMAPGAQGRIKVPASMAGALAGQESGVVARGQEDTSGLERPNDFVQPQTPMAASPKRPGWSLTSMLACLLSLAYTVILLTQLAAKRLQRKAPALACLLGGIVPAGLFLLLELGKPETVLFNRTTPLFVVLVAVHLVLAGFVLWGNKGKGANNKPK